MWPPGAIWIPSEGFRCGFTPFTRPRSMFTVPRFGIAAKPALLPMMSGVSMIHSTVSRLEA